MIHDFVAKKLIFSLLPVGVLLFFFTTAAFSQSHKKAESQNPSDDGRNTQFTRLASSETGIEFVSRLLPDHQYSYLYHSGMTCSGLAAGDIDGDGRPDLFLANGPGPNALYLQKGEEFHFEDVTSAAAEALDGGNNWAAGASLADIDNDGDLDLYVCNYQAPNQLFINTGPGQGQPVRFQEVAAAAGVDIVDASHAAAFCDYDNDGDLDFYLLTNRIEDPSGALADLPVEFKRPGVPSLLSGFSKYYDLWIVDAGNWGVEATGRLDYLFRNDGLDANGQVKFTDVTKRAGISGRGDGLSSVWWDADLDGDCDLYVCNDFIAQDRFYINNGDGTFTNKVAESLPHTTWFSMGSNVGDIDNDGDFDLLVADMSATSHYKSKVTMGIMGGLELRRANESNPPQYMRNSLLLNEANGTFREAAYLAGLSSSDWTWAVKMNDFDADGWLDVFLTNGVPREMNHSDINITHDMLIGKHMWEFFKEGEMRQEQNLAYRNLDGLKFENVSGSWGLDHVGASYGAVTADFDVDGDLDMAVMNLEENISIYRNEGSDNCQFTIRLEGTESNRHGVGATVTLQVGQQEMIRQLMPGTGYHSYDQPILHFGLGQTTKVDQIEVRWPSGIVQVLNNPQIEPQIVIREQGNRVAKKPEPAATLFDESLALENVWHQENNFNDFALQPLLPHRLSTEGPCMAWGDVNSDGRPDVFIGGAAGSAAELRLNNKDGRFESVSKLTFLRDLTGEDTAAQFGDFDRDGDLDLLVARGSYEFKKGEGNQLNLLYINDGAGNFAKADPTFVPETATNSGTLSVCDYDRDGDLDAFVGTRVRHGEYPLSDKSQLWINEQGKFSVDTGSEDILAEIGLVTGAVWADIDGDGWQDLLVAREWDTVAVFRNNQGQLIPDLETGELSEKTGWWGAIDAGDVDGDGDVDLVVSNVGLNTKYKTSTEKPMTVYYGDFDQSGKSHIVEVKQEGDVCYPERGRSCSSNAMPFIRNKFETYHDFGLATLNQIYGDDKLAAARKFTANTFEHALFLNDGSGKFELRALPRITQIAPSKTVALSDLDSDGDLDIAMGQNFFGPQSETGRYDGGLGQILVNDGTGDFAPVAPRASGFNVRETARVLYVGDIDGDGQPDIAVATNDGPVRLLLGNKND